RVVAQQGAVLVRARLTLGGVDDDRGRPGAGLEPGDRPPLPAGGEPGAAPAPEPGRLDLVDGPRRPQATGRLQAAAAPVPQILTEVFDGGRAEETGTFHVRPRTANGGGSNARVA